MISFLVGFQNSSCLFLRCTPYLYFALDLDINHTHGELSLSNVNAILFMYMPCQEQSWPPIVTSQMNPVVASMHWICKICIPRMNRTLQVRAQLSVRQSSGDGSNKAVFIHLVLGIQQVHARFSTELESPGHIYAESTMARPSLVRNEMYPESSRNHECSDCEMARITGDAQSLTVTRGTSSDI